MTLFRRYLDEEMVKIILFVPQETGRAAKSLLTTTEQPSSRFPSEGAMP
jgi:hypothetical protein